MAKEAVGSPESYRGFLSCSMMLPVLKKSTWRQDYPQSIFILIFSGYSDIYSLLRKKDEDNIFYVIMESH